MNGQLSQDILSKIIWIRGIPPIDFWVRREAMIGEFITRNKLKATDTTQFEMESMTAAGAEVKATKAPAIIRRPPFPGGIRVPHLHFKGEIYALTVEQWKSFSGAVVNDLHTKLANASALSFDQVRDIAEGIDKIG